MAGSLYGKPIVFAVVATVVILVGTIVTVFYPMLRPEMHPRLEALQPYTPLELAGKDIYQREGCNNCHTQTVRPLKTEVMRYGEYSKAGEFAYDRPFLWGSKRTGPDLARIGKKYPDAWHYLHFENPRTFYEKSNMPSYGWLKERKIDPSEIEVHMRALRLPFSPQDIESLHGKTEMDALVAYMQVIGIAVSKEAQASVPEKQEVEELKNPFSGDAEAAHRGEELYEDSCAVCHGEEGAGGIGPKLTDRIWLNKEGEISDAKLYEIIANGTGGGMPPFGNSMDKDKIWSLVTYIRSLREE